MQKLRPLAVVVGLGLVTGCTSGNGALEPGFTSANLNSNKLQLAVGVATFTTGAKGLNVVATYRQPNGLSGTLLNTPALTGPFTVPAGVKGSGGCTPNLDAGASQFTGSAQALTGAACTSLGQSGGVFAYGFAPENSTTAQTASFTLFGDAKYGGPFYGAQTLVSDGVGGAFRGGPPAYPTTRNGTYPAGFNGYTLGYTTLAVAPGAGTYTLNLNIQSGNTSGGSASTSANLANTAGLPAFAAAPTFTEDGNGGGTATCAAPAGTTETIVAIIDETNTAYYTSVQGGGNVTATFGPNIGPQASPTSTAPGPTILAGDKYEVECIAADYPLFEAGPPQNLSQSPTITGAGGQADISFSPPLDATYGGAATGTSVHRN